MAIEELERSAPAAPAPPPPAPPPAPSGPPPSALDAARQPIGADANTPPSPSPLDAARQPMSAVNLPNTPAPAAPPTTTPQDDQLHHESFGARMYHGVLNALGGTQDVALTGFDQKTGAPIYSTTQMTPGMQWKKIISGALTGLAAGAGQAPMKAFGSGYQAEQQQNQQQRLEQRQVAQQGFENQQKAAMNDANKSYLTTQTAGLTFANSRAKVAASVEDTNRMNSFNQLVSNAPKGSNLLGHFANMDDVTKAFKNDSRLHDQHAQGRIVAIPHVGADGVIDGVDAAYIARGWGETFADKDVTFTTQKFEDGKFKNVTQTIPAYSKTNDEIFTMMQAQAKDSMEAHWKEYEETSQAQLRKAQGTEAVAKAGESSAEAAKTNEETRVLKETGELPGTARTGGADSIAPEDMPATVKLIGEGRGNIKNLSRLISKNPGLIEEINKQYPDFREGAVATFDDNQKKFVGGQIGGSLNAAGTSAQHLTRLLQLNTPLSHVPGTPAHRAYMTEARIAAEELSKFYGGGKSTVSGTEGHLHDLGGIGPGRDDAINTTIGALADKYHEYEQQWQNGLPSKSWNIPMPTITPEAQTDLAVVEQQLAKRDPKYVRRLPQQGAASAPLGMPGAGQQGSTAQQGNTARQGNTPPARPPAVPADYVWNPQGNNGAGSWDHPQVQH